MSNEKLLALEGVSQAVRKGALSHLALEGMCWQAQQFKHIGEACRSGELTSYELERFRRHHLEHRDPGCGPDIRDWKRAQAAMGENFIHPYELERFFRQNMKFTDEQLKGLERIPYSTHVLQEKEGSILFPGHPHVDLAFLLAAFSENVGSQVRFVGIGEQTGALLASCLPYRYELGWHLVEMEPCGFSKAYSWLQRKEQVPVGYRMPRVLEFATAALLAEWRLILAGIHESNHPPAFTFSGAWCLDQVSKTYSGKSSFIVGPYEHTSTAKPVGLHVREVYESRGESNTELFLVREPDL